MVKLLSVVKGRKAGVFLAATACSVAPATAFAQDGPRLREEILVTARKREESLLEIPVAVSTLNQDEIITRSIFDTADLSEATGTTDCPGSPASMNLMANEGSTLSLAEKGTTR